MSTVDGSTTVRHLGNGERVVFGTCVCGTCGHDITLSEPVLPQLLGAVTAFDDHWKLDNLTTSTVLVVRDIEDPHQHIRLQPRRTGVVIPFELAIITDQPDAARLTVFGPEPDVDQTPPIPCQHYEPRQALDASATYFAVLQALCEPRLRGSVGCPLPTTKEIATRLRTRGILLTARAVEHHIDYLIDRLGLRPGALGAGHRAWKKELLAAAALRHNLLGQMT